MSDWGAVEYVEAVFCNRLISDNSTKADRSYFVPGGESLSILLLEFVIK